LYYGLFNSDIHEEIWQKLQQGAYPEALRQDPDYFWMFVCPAQAELAIAGFHSSQRQGCQLLSNPQKPTFWPGYDKSNKTSWR